MRFEFRLELGGGVPRAGNALQELCMSRASGRVFVRWSSFSNSCFCCNLIFVRVYHVVGVDHPPMAHTPTSAVDNSAQVDGPGPDRNPASCVHALCCGRASCHWPYGIDARTESGFVAYGDAAMAHFGTAMIVYHISCQNSKPKLGQVGRTLETQVTIADPAGPGLVYHIPYPKLKAKFGARGKNIGKQSNHRGSGWSLVTSCPSG